MSDKAVSWALTQTVRGPAGLLLRTLANEADDLGACGVHSVPALAARCGLPERTAYRALRLLRTTGRLIVHRRCSDQGLQVQSGFELNVDRPADREMTSASHWPVVVADRNRGGSANSVRFSAKGADPMVERPSKGTAKMAGREIGGSAKAADRELKGSAALPRRMFLPNNRNAVVNSIKKQQQTLANARTTRIQDASLFAQIQNEMCLGHGQVSSLFEEYSDEHLSAVRKYVEGRYRAGKVQKIKLAGYFLTVVRNATAESLCPKPSTLDLTAPTLARSDEELAADARSAAAREAARRAKLEAHVAWNALDEQRQSDLRNRFLADLAKDNRSVFDSLRRGASSAAGLEKDLLLQWIIKNTLHHPVSTSEAGGGGGNG